MKHEITKKINRVRIYALIANLIIGFVLYPMIGGFGALLIFGALFLIQVVVVKALMSILGYNEPPNGNDGENQQS